MDEETPRRELSVLRVGVAVVLTVALGVGAWSLVAFRSTGSPVARTTAWFAPYVDVTLTPTYPFQAQSANPATGVVLGFVVADPSSPCEPSWGAAYSLDEARSVLDLDSRIARLREEAKSVVVSFGGEANTELAVSCTDLASLTSAYASVVNRYKVSTIDFDVEGAAQGDAAANARRAKAVATLQREAAAAGGHLSVWLTLPVAPSGLTPAGVATVDSMLEAKVDLAGVNALVMDYGGSRPRQVSMLVASEQALRATRLQVEVAYEQSGLALSSGASWAKVGATPMIGQNDVSTDSFSLGAARALVSFVKKNGLARISMWSLNRDTPCGPNVVDPAVADNNCSGVGQTPLQYSQIFAALSGDPSAPTKAAAPVKVPTGPDNPATSPYPIWSEATEYPAGYKVVWRHAIFQAKWNNEGVVPDAPVASASDTPWVLIGPVLPGSRPVTMTTMAPGTYPVWSAKTAYPAGSRVLFDGIGYVAKWWSEGQAPDPLVPDSVGSPWRPIDPQPEQ